MYALCGENGVKIFDGKEQAAFFSHDNFLLRHENYRIVLDLRNIDFSLEELPNCSLLEAYRILRCKKKAMSNNETAFLVHSNRWNFLKKSTFYIQKNSLEHCEFFHRLFHEDGIFLMENVVAEFCESVAKIEAETWWLYAAEHEHGNLRIIAGMGRGIVFSRFLSNNSDICEEIFKTIIFLKRFGLEETIKIITALQGIETLSLQNVSFEIFKLEEHGESKLMYFLSNRKKIKKIFLRKNWLMQYFDMKQFYYLAFLAMCILCFAILTIHKEIANEEQKIMELNKAAIVDTQNFHLKINVNNFCFVKRFIDILKNSHNPLNELEKISRLCHENHIPIEQLYVENCYFAQIKTLLSKKELEKLQKSHLKGFEISLEKLETGDDEYEELGAHKKFGVLLCIKIK
ncbi:MAG: hypothetical protein LBP41_00710 [Holosporaceae bacterium]|jgi:hypothetical protein|nr:hypothetical protein [Holosporaceae bacterium]